MLTNRTLNDISEPERRDSDGQVDRGSRFRERDWPASPVEPAATRNRVNSPGSGFATAVANQYRAHRAVACSTCAVDMVWVSAAFPAWSELDRLPREDGFLLSLDMSWGGRRQRFLGDVCSWDGATQPHSIHLLDLDESPRLRVRGTFDILLVRLTRATLDEFADGSLLQPTPALHCLPGTLDPLLGAVGEALVCAMREPAPAARLYLDQLAAALVGKILASYSPAGAASARPRGALSPWQERRAKEFLAANLAEDVSLDDVARECRLSPGHFSKAFKRTTGKSPHFWLTERRVIAAQSLLRGSDMALAEIALACGFGDQSHLTRVFHKRTGCAPGQWRRMRS